MMVYFPLLYIMVEGMEWLLIIMLNLPPEKADIGDPRFPTKAECMAEGEKLLKSGTSSIRPKTKEGNRQTVVTLELERPVVRSEIECVEVAKFPVSGAFKEKVE